MIIMAMIIILVTQLITTLIMIMIIMVIMIIMTIITMIRIILTTNNSSTVHSIALLHNAKEYAFKSRKMPVTSLHSYGAFNFGCGFL
jgi:hypothetical protein